MAKFILQTDDGVMEDEERLVENLLLKNKYNHSYTKTSLKELKQNIEKFTDGVTRENIVIPIGTIEFVTEFISRAYGIEVENPIEIPVYLQRDEYLKRKYQIVNWENIPRQGKFFLKDVSRLKEFSEVVNASYIDIDEIFNYEPKHKYDSTLTLNKNHYFQVSQPLNIKSEYRVYVIGNDVVNICNYNGDPMLLPDTELINKIINEIIKNEPELRSYTIDLAVGNFGTALLEIHNFSSVGLYSTLWGHDLLYAYKDGLEYLLNDNKPNKFL